MQFLQEYPKAADGIHYLSKPDHSFEAVYLEVRDREKRIFADREAAMLPLTSSTNPHRKEWALRRQSFQRLKSYVHREGISGPILDLGCGNGWLSRHLADWTAQPIIGLDINTEELAQAARLSKHAHCSFVYADIFNAPLPEGTFHYLILNSVVQYFADPVGLIRRSLSLLRPGGEAHLLDSPFYQKELVAAASARSLAYYKKMGMEMMMDHYHHHSWEVLADFDYQVLYPRFEMWQSIKSKCGVRNNPFPWVRLRKRGVR